jgi:hypothetical protein
MAGSVADILYDPEDEPIFLSHKWHVSDSGYAVWRGVADGRKQTVRLHRLIMNAPPNTPVDHRNGNKLDNRRVNLRLCTTRENAANKHGVVGYTWDRSKRKWLVRYRQRFYGRYDTEDEAKIAYKLACSGVPYPKRQRRPKYHLPTGVLRTKATELIRRGLGLTGRGCTSGRSAPSKRLRKLI